ncbi:hypothetical protein CICLE_v10023208mg [Citrus x clementina]|uniref:Uncharacterized protein n=1 Tax=Citrus clementina TaxID=85681 RepID=V4TTC5_CITCL|nr:hypothetical protein CICLE_v10023208mg [Citrus x clementina]
MLEKLIRTKYKSNINHIHCCLHYIVDVANVGHFHFQILRTSSNEKDNVVAKHTAGAVAVIYKKLKHDMRF